MVALADCTIYWNKMPAKGLSRPYPLRVMCLNNETGTVNPDNYDHKTKLETTEELIDFVEELTQKYNMSAKIIRAELSVIDEYREYVS